MSRYLKNFCFFVNALIEIFYFQAKNSDVDYKVYTFVRKLYEAINSSLECFKKTKLALEQSSWEHKSLAQNHQEVCYFRKLDMKKADLIRVLNSTFSKMKPRL